jgi:hypothetical protein
MKRSRFSKIVAGGSAQASAGCDRNEITDYIQFHKDRRDENGQRLVVRNGQYL